MGRLALALPFLALAACTLPLSAPPLFPASAAVERLDFEEDTLNKTPNGLESRSKGSWVVADSPTAASGWQVVVRPRDEVPGTLSVEETAGSERIGGEVAVRVLLGPAGAGIGCETGDETGYLMKVEPEAKRVALYSRSKESMKLVAERSVAVEKGKWVRIGIVCEPRAVIGYLGGKPVLKDGEARGRVQLGLYADPGVIAHFDDLRYAVGKSDRAAR